MSAENIDTYALMNNTRRDFPRDETIPSLFATMVKEHSSVIAVKDDHRSLSYSRLDAESSAIAAKIQAALGPSAKPGVVAVFFERSCTTISSLLATLKCGHGYLPIEPGQPVERLRTVVADSGAALVVTAAKYVPICEEAFPNVPRILIDNDDQKATASFMPTMAPTPTSLACMMHTSGSTGKPKGVRVSHRNVLRLVHCDDYGDLSPATVTILYLPLSFDTSTYDIWGSLLHGGRVVIAPPGFLEPQALSACIRDNGVTVVAMTGGFFTALSRDPCIDEIAASLRDIITGGDLVAPAAIAMAYQHLPRTRIHCGYGVTECTSFATDFVVPRTWPADRALPIGTPIRNTTAYVLDDDMRPVPVGVIGELYLGGEGVCAGYHQMEEKTRKSFVDPPADLRAVCMSAKLYRTGDLAAVEHVDGKPVLKYAGRLEDQVKIRGKRVEVGDIETAIRRRTGVKDVAVVPCGTEPDNKRLLCFIALKSAPVDLARLLQLDLPAHMIPERILAVDGIPITDNGKVDRKKLLNSVDVGTLNSIKEEKAEAVKQEISTQTSVTAKRESATAESLHVRFRHYTLIKSDAPASLGSNISPFVMIACRAPSDWQSRLTSICRGLSSALNGVRVVCLQLVPEDEESTAAIATDYGLFLRRASNERLSLSKQLVGSAGIELSSISHSILLFVGGDAPERSIEDLVFFTRALRAGPSTSNFLMLSIVDADHDNGILSGFCAAACAELHDRMASCHSVTVVASKGNEVNAATHAALGELRASDQCDVVYREGQRYVRSLSPVSFDQSVTSALKHNGVYIVACGNRSLNTAVCNFLRQTFDAKLIVVGGRKQMPDAEEKEADSANIIRLVGDITDLAMLRGAIRSAESKWPKAPLCGAFNLWGTSNGPARVDEKAVVDCLRPADYLPQIEAKRARTIALSTILGEQRSEQLLILFSSLQACLPEAGMAVRVAGDRWLDAFARRSNKSNVRAICVHFGTWKDDACGTTSDGMEPTDALRAMVLAIQSTEPVCIDAKPAKRMSRQRTLSLTE